METFKVDIDKIFLILTSYKYPECLVMIMSTLNKKKLWKISAVFNIKNVHTIFDMWWTNLQLYSNVQDHDMQL